MRRFRWLLLVGAFVGVVLACGGGGGGSSLPEPDDGEEDPNTPEPETVEIARYVRVDLSQGGNEPMEVRVATVETDGISMRRAGSHLVVLRHEGEVVAVSPVLLSSEMEFEAGPGEASEVVDFGAIGGTAFVEAPSAADQVEVLDAEGVVVATTDIELDEWVPREQGLRTVKRALVTDLAGLRAAHPHIQFLASKDEVAWYWRANRFFHTEGDSDPVESCAEITDVQAANLHTALESISRPLRGAIGSLALCRLTGTRRALLAGVTGNLMVINTRVADFWYSGNVLNDVDLATDHPDRLVGLVAHEAAHSWHHSANGDAFTDISTHPADVQAELQALRSQFQGRKPVDATFLRAHETARALPGTAVLAYDSLANGEPLDVYARAGFVSHNGSTGYKEDFADYVSLFWSIDDTPESHPMCQAFRDAAGRVFPEEYVVNFTKLQVVRQFGLISESDLRRCIGEVDPASGDGFWLDGADFGGSLQIGVADGHDANHYRLLALGSNPGSSFQALLQIPLPRALSPIGLHVFDPAAAAKINSSSVPETAVTTLIVTDPSLPPGAVALSASVANAGFAVVTRADTTGVQGYLFFVGYANNTSVDDTRFGWFRLDY